jgi:RimJ/RimL family protein N-acetyltransferase
VTGPLVAPDPPLTEGAVRLRGLEDRDVPNFARALEDPGVFDLAYSGQLAADERAVAEYVRRFRATRTANEEAILMAFADAADEMAGLGMVFAINPRNLDAEIGFWVAPWARGSGTGLAGLRLLVRWAFEAFGLERLHAHTNPANAPARGLLERGGFTVEGTLRGADRTASGERRDSVSYSLLITDPRNP